jgi:periplasmic copper chaperone A
VGKGVGGIVLAAIISMSAGEAGAQISLSQSTFEAGVNFAAFFQVERGCGASPTTALQVQIPDGVSVIEVPQKPGWSVGEERVRQRVVAVTWRGMADRVKPEQFGLLLKLPEQPGPLYFATTQRCAEAEIRWMEIPGAGSGSSLAHPAPKLMLVAAVPNAHAQHGSLIAIEQPWARATPPGAQTAAAYVTIVNHSAEKDVLVAASTPEAARVEFHETTMTDGIMRMRPAPRGIAVPPHGALELNPNGGYHIMLSGLKAPLKSGTMLPVTLRFAKAGSIEVVFAVEPIGARGPSAGAAPEHANH